MQKKYLNLKILIFTFKSVANSIKSMSFLFALSTLNASDFRAFKLEEFGDWLNFKTNYAVSLFDEKFRFKTLHSNQEPSNQSRLEVQLTSPTENPM